MPINSPITAQRGLLAEWLETNRSGIVASWMEAVKNDTEIPDTDRLTQAALQDHLPEMLAELIAVVRDPARPEESEIHRTAQKHGAARWRNGYRLDEILRELTRVREIVLARVQNFCQDHQLPALRDDAESTVRRFYDKVVATSVRQFMREQEAEVVLRTRQLHHAYEQVEAATDQLRAVAESRLQLLRGVSHELRNALQTVSFDATSMIEEKDPESRKAVFAQLYGSIIHLQRILDRLQKFSKILGGEMRLNVESLKLQDFLDDLGQKHRETAQRKGLQFRCAVSDDLKRASVDREKLEYIAEIFIANAIDYTERGSVAVTLRSDGPDRWLFIVEDTGRGIAEEDAPRVFREFHRSEANPTGGVHLSLVIARHLARLMGAEITFKSSPGKGSCFEIHMPMDVGANAPPIDPMLNA